MRQKLQVGGLLVIMILRQRTTNGMGVIICPRIGEMTTTKGAQLLFSMELGGKEEEIGWFLLLLFRLRRHCLIRLVSSSSSSKDNYHLGWG